MKIDKNMAFECNQTNSVILRFYSWKYPVLSLGYGQKPKGFINTTYCSENNINIIRRPTGGRAVYHNSEISYCIACCDKNELFSKSISDSYKIINTAIVSGLKQLGVDAYLYNKKDRQNVQSPACFSIFSSHEIVVKGKKIAGSAQRRFKNSFIQHGSILQEIDEEAMINIFGKHNIGEYGNFLNRMTSLQNEITGDFQIDNLLTALTHGFKEVFDFSFC